MRKKVLVLMSTYNGEKYIDEQLMSLFLQEEVDVSVLIRDDGSTDQTINLIKKWQNKLDIEVYSGENIKPAKSFMDLVQHSGEYEYYAFCDQDDYWKSDKLKCALNILDRVEDLPALYYSATEIADESLNPLFVNPVNSYGTFENALIKNEAVGCTEVFNLKLMRALKKHIPNFIMMHDSWVCRVCYAIGGFIYIDQTPHILYRQHYDNVLGYKEPRLKKMMTQFEIAFKKNIRIRQMIANELLNGYREEISGDNKKILEALTDYNIRATSKMFLIKNRQFRTPSKKINIQMLAAILLNRF